MSKNKGPSKYGHAELALQLIRAYPAQVINFQQRGAAIMFQCMRAKFVNMPAAANA